MQSTSVYYKKTENPYLLYRGFKGGDDIFDTKTLTFAITVSTEFFTLSDKLVVPNSRERGDFKQQILALLLSHHSQLVSHKICLHFAIVEGLCMSWSSLEAYRIKPSMMRKPTFNPVKKTTGATIGYDVRVANNNLRYNLRLPWRKKKISVLISNADCSAAT